MAKKLPIILVCLLLILFIYGLYKDVAERVKGANLAVPYVLVKFPDAEKAIGIEVTLALHDISNVLQVSDYRAAVAKEVINVVQRTGYKTMTSIAGREAFPGELKTALVDLLGEIDYDFLVTQFDVVKLQAATPKWQSFASDDDTHYYIDMDAILNVGQSTKAWFVMDSDQPKVSNGKPYSSILALHEFDCAESLNKTLTQTAYSKPLATGEVVFDVAVPAPVHWEPVEPGTFLYYMHTKACQ